MLAESPHGTSARNDSPASGQNLIVESFLETDSIHHRPACLPERRGQEPGKGGEKNGHQEDWRECNHWTLHVRESGAVPRKQADRDCAYDQVLS